jgi:hypothetical protein
MGQVAVHREDSPEDGEMNGEIHTWMRRRNA